jgi:hypothetical protein
MMAVTILESGLASCVTEPRCRHNLEDNGLSEPNRFDRCQDEKGRYCQVYPERNHLIIHIRVIRRGVIAISTFGLP